jgi:hypothetical protein
MYAIFDKEKNDLHKDLETKESTLFISYEQAVEELEKLVDFCELCDHQSFVENKTIVRIIFGDDGIKIGDEIL